MIQGLGAGALMAKANNRSDFLFVASAPYNYFDQLGFNFLEKYFVTNVLPLGCSTLSATFEHFQYFHLRFIRRTTGLDHCPPLRWLFCDRRIEYEAS